MPEPYKIPRPMPPQVIWGVWDRFGRPAPQNPSAGGQYRIGWMIYPNYGYTNLVSPTRDIIDRDIPRCTSFYSGRLASLMRESFDVTQYLMGKTITGIRLIRSHNINIFVEGHELPLVFYVRSRWWGRPPEITMPAGDGPCVVKKMLKSHKAIRLEDGRSILLDIYGKLKLSTIPPSIEQEIFSD